MNGKTANHPSGKPTADALAEMIIETVLNQWPETAVVFHQYNMACVGCAVANFYTIADAADVYGLPQEPFVEELLSVIK